MADRYEQFAGIAPQTGQRNTINGTPKGNSLEAALRQSEERFRFIIDTIPGFVCTLEASGEVELVNRQVLDISVKRLRN